MEYALALAAAGGIFFVLVSWILELVGSNPHDEMRLSTDERIAHLRTEELVRAFSEEGLPPLNRSGVWAGIAAIWKSVRWMVLRSGRWVALLWLACFALACLGLVFKTAFLPDSHDLRLLLGAREFIEFQLKPRKKKRTKPRP